jgi:hypothetical protein
MTIKNLAEAFMRSKEDLDRALSVETFKEVMNAGQYNGVVHNLGLSDIFHIS